MEQRNEQNNQGNLAWKAESKRSPPAVDEQADKLRERQAGLPYPAIPGLFATSYIPRIVTESEVHLRAGSFESHNTCRQDPLTVSGSVSRYFVWLSPTPLQLAWLYPARVGSCQRIAQNNHRMKEKNNPWSMFSHKSCFDIFDAGNNEYRSQWRHQQSARRQHHRNYSTSNYDRNSHYGDCSDIHGGFCYSHCCGKSRIYTHCHGIQGSHEMSECRNFHSHDPARYSNSSLRQLMNSPLHGPIVRTRPGSK